MISGPPARTGGEAAAQATVAELGIGRAIVSEGPAKHGAIEGFAALNVVDVEFDVVDFVGAVVGSHAHLLESEHYSCTQEVEQINAGGGMPPPECSGFAPGLVPGADCAFDIANAVAVTNAAGRQTGAGQFIEQAGVGLRANGQYH